MHKILRNCGVTIGLAYLGTAMLSQAAETQSTHSILRLAPLNPTVVNSRVDSELLPPALPDAELFNSTNSPPNVAKSAVGHSSADGDGQGETASHPIAEGPSCRGPCSCFGWLRDCIARKRAIYWGNVQEFEERPLGTWMYAQMNTQVVNGLADQMALYKYDFYDENSDSPSALTARGKIQLRKMANILMFNYFPIMVEGTGNTQLDDARRKTVFDELGRLSTRVSEDQIVTGTPSNGGLSGLEAVEVYQNLLQQTRGQGGSLGGGGSGTAGFSGNAQIGGGVISGR